MYAKSAKYLTYDNKSDKKIRETQSVALNREFELKANILIS